MLLSASRFNGNEVVYWLVNSSLNGGFTRQSIRGINFVAEKKASPIFPAATVVLTRDSEQGIEVLMVKRQQKLSAYGGAWVFPGGKVDPHEVEAADDELGAAHVAAVREVKEETGLDLESGALRPFSYWLTPAIRPKRFSTWFFMADCSVISTDNVQVDQGELSAFQWLAPKDVLDQHSAGEMELLPPTYISLWEFSKFSSVGDLVGELAIRPIEYFRPHMLPLPEGGHCSLYEGDAGYDAQDVSAQGARRRLEMRGTQWDYLK